MRRGKFFIKRKKLYKSDRQINPFLNIRKRSLKRHLIVERQVKHSFFGEYSYEFERRNPLLYIDFQYNDPPQIQHEWIVPIGRRDD